MAVVSPERTHSPWFELAIAALHRQAGHCRLCGQRLDSLRTRQCLLLESDLTKTVGSDSLKNVRVLAFSGETERRASRSIL